MTEQTRPGDPYGFKAGLHRLSDARLVQRFNDECGKPGWVRARANFLKALSEEIRRRGIDAGGFTQGGLDLSRLAKLENGMMVPVEGPSGKPDSPGGGRVVRISESDHGHES